MEQNKRESFQTPYEQYKECKGIKFEIIGYNQKEDNDGSETFTIKLQNDKIIEALPEEIFSGLGWEPI